MGAALKSPLTQSHYKILREKLAALTGIDLGESKHSLVESRLYKRLGALQYDDFSQYIDLLHQSPDEITHFINGLTTNKTDWFREPRHFTYLVNTILPELCAWPPSGEKTIYLWSAACSSGEEVYSLAMALKEHLNPHYDYRILGTDISTEVLAKAKTATYSARTVNEQVPDRFRERYFVDDSSSVRVLPELCRNVKLKQFNLIQDKLQSEIRFDVIFLRNVLIYFSRATIEQVVREVIQYLKPGGYLFIGHTESLHGLSLPLTLVSESVYQVKG